MSWVPAVSEEQASPEVKRIYDYLRENWGFVPNYFLALSAQPQFLQDQVNLFTHVMIDEHALSKIIKEQIALVVSGINLSNYCLAAHLEILGRLGIDKSLSRKLALSYESAPVEPRVMAPSSVTPISSAAVPRTWKNPMWTASVNTAGKTPPFSKRPSSSRSTPARTVSLPESASSPISRRLAMNQRFSRRALPPSVLAFLRRASLLLTVV